MKTKLAIDFSLFLLLTALPLAAQPTAGEPATEWSCASVALSSDDPSLPYRLVAPYLQRRPDFQASRLVLGEDPAAGDAIVKLEPGEVGHTKIVVTNRATGDRRSSSSGWTDYPGMVASDVMERIKEVCTQDVTAPDRPLSAQVTGEPLQTHPVRSLAACSHTSWMDNRELYEALKSRDEFARQSVQLLPDCRSGRTAVAVTHNLDRTAEWSWTLKTPSGQAISTGMVIASSSGTAAAKIADSVARDTPTVAYDQSQDAAIGGTATEVSDAVVAHKGQGFKHFMGRAGFYSGQALLLAADVAGYAALALAESGY
jgi:hypothetical protein